MKDMFKRFDLKFILAGITCLGLVVTAIVGDLQKVINFSDPINEIFFTLFATMLGVLFFLICKKDENKVAPK